MVCTHTQPIEVAQEKMRKDWGHVTIKNQQNTKVAREEKAESNYKTENNLQNDNSKSFCISISLDIKRLNCTIKRHRVAKWIKKLRSSYMLSARDSI